MSHRAWRVDLVERARGAWTERQAQRPAPGPDSTTDVRSIDLVALARGSHLAVEVVDDGQRNGQQ